VVYAPQPRVYVVGDDCFQYNGYYYRCDGDEWFRADSFDGPWYSLDLGYVPRVVIGYRGRYGGGYGYRDRAYLGGSRFRGDVRIEGGRRWDGGGRGWEDRGRLDVRRDGGERRDGWNGRRDGGEGHAWSGERRDGGDHRSWGGSRERGGNDSRDRHESNDNRGWHGREQ